MTTLFDDDRRIRRVRAAAAATAARQYGPTVPAPVLWFPQTAAALADAGDALFLLAGTDEAAPYTQLMAALGPFVGPSRQFDPDRLLEVLRELDGEFITRAHRFHDAIGLAMLTLEAAIGNQR